MNDVTSISSTQKSSHRIPWFIGALMILIVSPVILQVPDALRRGDHGILMALIFPLIGCGLVWLGFHMKKKFLFFGPTPLMPSPATGQAGGEAGGIITIGRDIGNRQLKITLKCQHTYSTGSGNNSRTHTDTLWQETTTGFSRRIPGKTTVAFIFPVPADLPSSGRKQHGMRGTVRWMVTAEGLIDYREFKRDWELPVEKGTGTSSAPVPASHTDKIRSEQIREAEKSAEEQIEFTESGEHFNVSSEAGRHNTSDILLSVIGLIFFISGIVIYNLAESGFGTTMMAIVFSGLGGLFLFGGIWQMGHSLDVKLKDETVYVTRRVFGRIISENHGHLYSPEQLELKTGSRSEINGNVTVYMDIYANLKDKNGHQTRLKIVERISGRQAGEAVLRKISNAISKKLDMDLGDI